VPAPADEELRALVETARTLRRRKRLTQERVGLDGGLGGKYVGKLERRELVPGLPAIVGVARGLGMTPAAFMRALAERLDDAERDGQ
jgi:transcriptional regulator with XRE-family HTH domain